MGIVAWLVVGLIAGVLAKLAMPGPDPGGMVITIVVGIVGALLGGFIVNRILGGPGVTSINLLSILVATLGSVILLALYRLLTRRAAR
ncbi:MAG: GlsB/YeaQ/YmgE family stress response membrane protein [Actinomycetota bacterium]|nr:GlsB/YeaQ/YmgE family stress response membrane protein [Actinomycetota bacterium]